MLDTNIIVYILNSRPEKIRKRFTRYSPEDICISSVTLAELEYGICNSSRPDQNRIALMMFLADIDVIPFDAQAAADYGEIRFDLKRKGTPIGANDLLIAAHARSLGLTLVTNNSREFDRVDGLKVENWA